MISDQPGVGYFESIVLRGRGDDETATPLFVGFTEKGAVQSYSIQTLQDYEDQLGGGFEPTDQSTLLPVLYYTVRHYFDNGGKACFVYSLGSYSALTGLALDAFVDLLNDERVAQTIASESRIRVVAVPDLALLDTLLKPNSDEATTWSGAWQRVLAWCESRRGVFGVLDAPVSAQSAKRCAQKFSTLVDADRRAWVAAYWPRLVSDYEKKTTRTTDAADAASASTHKPVLALSGTEPLAVERAVIPYLPNTPSVSVRAADTAREWKALDAESPWQVVPPSGAVAAAIATVDRVRGIWSAPANVQLAHVVKPALPYTDADDLFEDDGISVNLIRSFAGRGVKIWGCRTLADGTVLDWRYVQVRRFVAHVEASLTELARFVVFEPNNEITWMKLKGQTLSWLHAMWMQGALAGVQEQDAYRVLVGRDESMTSEDILQGKLIMKVDLAILQPAEFIRIDLQFRTNEPYTWQSPLKGNARLAGRALQS